MATLKTPRVAVPRPPAHLNDRTRKWFASVCEQYELQEHHLRLLTLAGEAWDRCEQAREALGREGLTFTDRFGAPHSRPEIAIERDSRIAFARLVRELDLDVEAPNEGRTRPPGLRSNSRM